MKNYLLILIFLLNSFTFGTEINDYVRRLFYYSVESKDSLKKFEKILNKIQNSSDKSFYNLYKGAYYTLIAKHSFNPYTKYVNLKKGLEYIGQAISEKEDDLEYRFVRLSILNYVPSFLGYDDVFFKDFEKTISLIERMNFEKVDKKTQIGILEFLIRSKKISDYKKPYLYILINRIKQ